MIFRDLRVNKLDYSVLALLAGGFVTFSLLNTNHPYQLFVSTIIFAILYVLWGGWHHAQSHHLTWRIVLEYLLVAVLGVVIVSTLLI